MNKYSGRLGEWDFVVCREPQLLADAFAKLAESRNERLKLTADLLLIQAQEEVGRLRSVGWRQADFAKALRELFVKRMD